MLCGLCSHLHAYNTQKTMQAYINSYKNKTHCWLSAHRELGHAFSVASFQSDPRKVWSPLITGPDLYPVPQWWWPPLVPQSSLHRTVEAQEL